jgi:UDP-N-acetylmuramate--alanine ligase
MDFARLKQQKKVHFIGIGGIGMSALAFILRQFNIEVQGSDLTENYLTEKLREKGVKYFVGHDAKNIDEDVSLIVQTSIIKSQNPEILEAQKRGIEIITRAQLLAIVMTQYQGITIAGTHGKTSTTGMVSLMLEHGNFDPTVINGGVIHYYGSNSKLGNGDFLVAESDESDASFVTLPSFIGAVTNIEPEHLEFAGYGGDFEKQKAYFEQYVSQIPDDGMCILCIDSAEVAKIHAKLDASKPHLFSYSAQGKNADLNIENIKSNSSGISFDAIFNDGLEIHEIKMPIYGAHNASNAAVAVVIGRFLGMAASEIKAALAKFTGVKRRFTKVGEFAGASIIDDYGHHPTEISTTLQAARDVIGENHKLICVFEPHKYSRVQSVFNEFCQAFSACDAVIVTDIYSAGQQPIAGISQDSLIAGMKEAGAKNVIKLENPQDLAKIVKPLISSGDMVFCTGAGKITYMASDLEKQLENL